MRQFIKFTFASCLGVILASCVLFILLIMIGVSAAGAGKSAMIKDKSVLSLDLNYLIPEHTNNTAAPTFDLQQQDVIGLHDILEMISAAKTDPKIQGIYLSPANVNLGPAKTGLLADALQDFRATGKWVLSYANYYGQGGYALAAQADTIILNPIGSVDFRGFAAFIPFFKDLLDKTGIKMEIYYAGDYKGATESFRRTDMSPENRLQTREYLDDIYALFLETISKGRNIEVARLREIANEMQSRDAGSALALGLVDEIGYEDEAHDWMRRRIGLSENADITFASTQEYFTGYKRTSSTSKNRIAIVYAEGDIVPGKGEYGMISDERYVKVLRDLRKSDRVKAVVLRVNSPGGSLLASENILRELSLLQKEGKPLIASMGDYAASGGYYLSAIADSIFAEPGTLTGSIGVFSMFPNPHALLRDKLGISFDTVRTGNYSASFSPVFEWSEPEHRAMQARTDEFYELFLNHVAKSRNMTRDEVHAIAQGRIWSGDRALGHGLVDRIGTMEDAIASAAALASLGEDYRTTEYPRALNPLNKLLNQLSGQDVSIAERFMQSQFAKHIPGYADFRALLRHSGPVARLPFVLRY